MEDAQTAQLAAIGDADTRTKAQGAYETYKKIYDELDAKEKQASKELSTAQTMQTDQKYNALANSPDFKEYSQKGADTSEVTYSRTTTPTTNLSGAKSKVNILYTFMTDKEADIYNYILAKEGKESAQKYLDHMEETLNYRMGTSTAKTVTDRSNPLVTGMYGIGAGFDQFASGAKQLFTDERVPTSAMQFGSAAVREELGGPKLPDWLGGGTLGQAAYDITTTTANMAPSILLSTITCRAWRSCRDRFRCGRSNARRISGRQRLQSGLKEDTQKQAEEL